MTCQNYPWNRRVTAGTLVQAAQHVHDVYWYNVRINIVSVRVFNRHQSSPYSTLATKYMYPYPGRLLSYSITYP